MAGAINLGNFPLSDGAAAAYSIDYNDQLQATRLNGTNGSAGVSCTVTVQGLNADGTPNANAIYSLLLNPGTAGFVAIPPSGAGAIQLAVNSRGRVAGFNTSTG